ncbi:hypothetical protein K474DRAFT_904150 [Panus rudis PR-1116 ss-1]|nr:hypothetical protein K474DRAFT_904150 [Panus rudis PR-1116 ss-1]
MKLVTLPPHLHFLYVVSRHCCTTMQRRHICPAASPVAEPSRNSGREPNPQSFPYLTQTRMPPSTAAYAVPLALVGAVIIFAVVLSFYCRRRLFVERAMDGKNTISGTSTVRCPSSVLGNTFGSRGNSVSDYAHDDKDTYTSIYTPRPLSYSRTPRATTREPFSGRSVPARTFRAPASPNYTKFSRDDVESPTTESGRTVDTDTSEVILPHYLRSSSPATPHPTPTPPKRIHVRRGTSQTAHVVSRHGERHSRQDVYDKVAQRVARL